MVAHPVPLRPDLIDPTVYRPQAFYELDVSDRWRQIEPTLAHFVFERTLNGFRRTATKPTRAFSFTSGPTAFLNTAISSKALSVTSTASSRRTQLLSTHMTPFCSLPASSALSATTDASTQALVLTMSADTNLRSIPAGVSFPTVD